MDPRLLDYYNRELAYMRESASEFAALHPAVAAGLGLGSGDFADPHVERLIEAFCFLSARTQIKLDAEFPRFTQRLLEVIHPNHVAPTPSIAVARFLPSKGVGDPSRSVVVPRGTELLTAVPAGERTACRFTTTQPVNIWPVELCAAELTGPPADLCRLLHGSAQNFCAGIAVQGALRLRLRTTRDITFAKMTGLDSLPVHLCGDERIASRLFALLHGASVATLTRPVGELQCHVHVVVPAALSHVGMEPGEGALPLPWNRFHGHNLLQEYFACPQRFLFVGLDRLGQGLSRIEGKEAEIFVLLSKAPGDLATDVGPANFALFCTPIVNLFHKRLDRIEVRPGAVEFHAVADRQHPTDFEIHTIHSLVGDCTADGEGIEFRPLFTTLSSDDGNHGRYFSMRRERRLLSEQGRCKFAHTGYAGTEAFISLVDQHAAPYPDTLRHLSGQGLVTNRDLPMRVARNGRDDLTASASIAVESIGMICAPSAPRCACTDGEMAWRLIRLLSTSQLPLHASEAGDAGRGMRELLRLFIAEHDAEQRARLGSLVDMKVSAVTRRIPGNGPLVHARGLQCRLIVDEEGFSGGDPYLFGLILDRFLAAHISINGFSETELHSLQRGLVHRWPVRMGGRGKA